MAGDTHRADESTLTRADGENERPAGRDRAAASDASEARACMPCRGTGVVISNLGGTRSELPCPWCGGTGVRQPGVLMMHAMVGFVEQRESQEVAEWPLRNDAPGRSIHR